MLTLPLSCALAAPASVSASGSDTTASDPIPTRWRNYALATISPMFAWAQQAKVAEPQVTDLLVEGGSLAFALGALGVDAQATIGVSVARGTVDERVNVLSMPKVDPFAELPRVGLQRTVVAPSYQQRWGDGGSLGITAVLAYQRFASLGLGEVSMHEGMPAWPVLAGETSYGGGLRVDAGNRIGDKLDWTIGYQSRVNMDAFNTYRGVYSDPGQFDIPASASVGLRYALTPSMSLDIGAQRVMYSAVTPFTSAALPRRFLALLGTSASPEFAWRDLDVYSAGWTWRAPAFGTVELRYTTRQQPLPTSALLRSALDAEPADHTFALGYSRATGRHAQLSFQAVYSSAPYFLGVPSYRASADTTGESVEFEALWAMRF
ncbi:MAG: hypothetical protein J0L88_04040 [Xanthomonadales bacterium]|nr:hypothetical protein [Xanthomonadales bacterium]